MALADAFLKGENIINNMRAGNIINARARYAMPMEEAKLSQEQTNAQYLPEKMRLDNQYQGLINQYYGPDKQSEINYRNTETKFTPLKYAIEAQNSNRQNSRYSDASQLIRYINGMKQGDQDIYLSNPDNLAARDNALKMVQEGLGNKQGGSTLLTPEFLKQFGLQQEMASSPGMAQQNSPHQDIQSPPQQQGGLGASMPLDSQSPNAQQPMQPPGVVTIPGVGEVQTPEGASSQRQEGLGAVHPVVKDAVAQHIAENAPNQTLSTNERMTLAHQSLANQKAAGASVWRRAQSAIALENFLQDNKEKYAPRLLNASKYAGALGRGKRFADQLAKETPAALEDYIWVQNQFIPNLSNNVKQMEQLSSSNKQRDELHRMVDSSIDNLTVDPKTSVKLLNRLFDLYGDQAKATLKAAQPVTPGVLEKLNGIHNESGNYLDKRNKSEMISVIYKGRSASIPRSKLAEAKKLQGLEVVNG